MSIASVQEPTAPSRSALLSPRESEVLALVAEGLTNTEIAATLVISVATVKTHVAQLLRKLRARDRVALVVLAWQERAADARRSTGSPPRSGRMARSHGERCRARHA